MKSPVCSYNEWDPLEEIIIGTIDGVTAPVVTHEMKTFVREDIGGLQQLGEINHKKAFKLLQF